MKMEAIGDAEPHSCSALRFVTDDMGNGVVRILLAHQATAAEAEAFMADVEVLTLGEAELEGMRGVVVAAFDMASAPRPLAYLGAVRSLTDLARESFIWAL